MQTFDDPVLVIAISEVTKSDAKFIQIAEAPDPEQLLFERAEEPFDASVGIGIQLRPMVTLRSDISE